MSLTVSSSTEPGSIHFVSIAHLAPCLIRERTSSTLILRMKKIAGVHVHLNFLFY